MNQESSQYPILNLNGSVCMTYGQLGDKCFIYEDCYGELVCNTIATTSQKCRIKMARFFYGFIFHHFKLKSKNTVLWRIKFCTFQNKRMFLFTFEKCAKNHLKIKKKSFFCRKKLKLVCLQILILHKTVLHKDFLDRFWF